MLKTTTKLFCGGVLLATCLSSAGAWAANPATLPLLLSAASLGADGKSTAAQADDLLREARQAMAEGNYEIADSKISRAEKLEPKYPLFHMGDTPKKVRADLDKVMAQKAAAGDPSLKHAPAKGNRSSDTVPADPFKVRSSPTVSGRAGNSGDMAAPNGTDSNAASANSKPAGLRPDLSASAMETATASPTNPSLPTGLRTPGSTIADALGTSSGVGANNLSVKSGVRKGSALDAEGPNPWEINASMPAGGSSNSPRSPIVGAPIVNLPIVAAPGDRAPANLPAYEIANSLAGGSAVPNAADLRSNSNSAPGSLDVSNQLAPIETAQSRYGSTSASEDSLNAVNKQHAVEMTKQARAAMARGDWSYAEQFARQAEMLVPDTAFAAGEDRPALVLLDIQRAKRSGANAVLAGADAVRAGVDAARSGVDAARAVAALPVEGNRYGVSNALYDPAKDYTQNVPAVATMQAPGSEPTPDNGTGEAMRWYRLGKDAMAHSKTDEAVQDFRRAYAFQAELDSNTRRQLNDYLKMLGSPIDSAVNSAGLANQGLPSIGPAKSDIASTANSPAWPNRSPLATPAVLTPDSSRLQAANYGANPQTAMAPGLIPPGSIAAAATPPSAGAPPAALDNVPSPSPVETGQSITRQVAAEVARQQSLARDMREKQPKQALETLQKTRDMVSSIGGLDQAAREQLLRRLDMSISDLQQYIAKNAPQIELDDRNRKIEADVDSTRKQKVVVQEKLAYIVNDFNKAIDEQRYPEAQLLAKKATELDPENPVVSQLNVMARQIPRMAQIDKLKTDKEAGVIDTLYAVDTASIPFAGDFAMPDAKKWNQLTESRARRLHDGQIRHTPKEQEIEQRLNTPMELKFDKRPLSEVIEYLGKIAQVPIYADPQGLQTEGVTSDTPITIDLSQDISLKSALNLILEPLHLTYVIKDEVLKITSESVKRNELIQITYQVGDLVTRIPNFSPTGREGINNAMREAYERTGWAGAAGGSFGTASPLTVSMNDPGNGAGFTPNPAVLAQIQQHPGFPLIGGGSGSTSSGTPQNIPFGPGGLKGGAQADFDPLIDLITSTIEKETWSEMGGNGTIEPFETNLSLVISQTQEVHEKIADLLQQLRRLQDLQVTIEVRFITLEDDFFERMGVDFNFNIATNTNPLTPIGTGLPQSFGPINPSELVGLDPTGAVTAARDIQYRATGLGTVIPPFGPAGATTDAATFGFAILSDIQAFFVVQAAQGDTRSNILQAPKVTLFNGQEASVQDLTQIPFVISVTPVVGDFAAAQQPVIVVLSQGTSLTVQAVASNDRRFVRLTVVPFFSTIGQVNTFTFSGSSSTTQKSSDSKSGSTDTTNSNEDDSSSTGTTVQLPQFTFTTVSTTVSVPDGGTVLLGGIKRLSEGRTEVGVPVLSKLPYINRLFRNTGIGRQTSSLMMMVTPRIIIQEEEAAAIEGTNNTQ